jgi:DNA-directed RNA polymerase specialized sigma24 family protein
MNAEDYLEQAYRLNDLIRCNKQELDELHLLADSIPGTDFSKERVQTSPSNEAGFTKIILKIIELENTINDEIEKLLSLKLEIRTVINAVSDNEEKLLLKYKYLNFLSWEDVAEKMNVSIRTVYRIRASALEHVKVPEKSRLF